MFKLDRYGAAAALALAALPAGCAANTTPHAPGRGVTAADFIPAHVVYRAGYRPGYPEFPTDLDFLDCEGLHPEQMAGIQHSFWPLIDPVHSDYSDFIEAVVVKGVDNEPEKTTFTIWLGNGRRLDSGPIFTDKHGKQIAYDGHKMGAAMYTRALQMLKKEIPAWKLKAAENPQTWWFDPELASPPVRGTLADHFIPYIGRFQEDYRSGNPLQSPSMDYLDCEALNMADLQEHFAAPLIHGKYSAFIGAVVFTGVYDDEVQSTFKIWLLDGRCLDSIPYVTDKHGQIHFIGYDYNKMGEVMYARAMRMLKKRFQPRK